MATIKETGISLTIKPFLQYSNVLAEQLDTLVKRSNKIITRTQINKGDLITQTQGITRNIIRALLEAMPFVMNGLDERLKNELVKKGLDAVSEGVNKNTFVHILNREVLDKLGASKAKTVDLSFSHILAMHTGNILHTPVKNFQLHLRFKALSPVLANHLAILGERSVKNDGKPYILSYARLRNSLLSFHEMLPTIFTKLPVDVADRLFNQGLNCLNSNDDYNLIEYLGVHESANTTNLKIRFDVALTNIKTMHLNRECYPFSHIELKHQKVDISRAMILSFSEFSDLKNLIQSVYPKLEGDGHGISNPAIDTIHKSVNNIIELLQNDLKGVGNKIPLKNRLVNYSALVKGYIKKRSTPPYAFNHLLKLISPSVYGDYKSIRLYGKKRFQDYLLSISEEFTQQYSEYLHIKEESYLTKLNQKKSFAKHLEMYEGDQKISFVISMIKEKGVSGLADNNYLGFITLSEHIEFLGDVKPPYTNHALYTAIDLYNFINKTNFRLYHILPHTLIFENENDGTISALSFSFIAKLYPLVFEDLNKYVEVSKIRIDGAAIQQVTLKSQMAKVLTIFKKYHETLNSTDVELLNKKGMKAFGCNSAELLDHIRQLIQIDYKASKLTPSYATQLQASLNQIVLFFDVPKSNRYLVSSSKTERLANRNNRNDMYSFQQVVEIAYAIESSLKRKNLTNLQRLCLYAARIFVKTGWNLTPTLELDYDDLVYFDVPFQGNKTAAVRLFKRRANYQTNWPKFAVTEQNPSMDASSALSEFETGKVTTAVISNIEAIREMTNGLAELHVSPNLRRRIFAYPCGANVRILSVRSFTQCINRLLKKEGFIESFSVGKIRKKGMNYTYRKVAKNFEIYQQAGMHTPQAFYEYYLKMDGEEVQATLTEATRVMGDFLIRGDTEKVIFVDKAPEESKQTPSGRCVQTHDSNVVTDFRKQNRSFFEDNDEITGCADFGACLFCYHFRCIM